MSSLFLPDGTNMANDAHIMCELVTSPEMWADWKAKLPVIINAAARVALLSAALLAAGSLA